MTGWKFFLALAFCLCFFLCACDEKNVPEGVVATVNGEPVELHSLQTLMDCRSASLGIPSKPSLEDMQSNYLNALTILIAHTLVRQELVSRGINLDENAFNLLLDKINADYGDNKLNEYLAESSIREDDWNQLLKDYLALETFRNQVLVPEIAITKNEIKKYYDEHINDFKVPETIKLCFPQARSEEDLKKICADIADIANNKTICLEMLPDEIPADIMKEIKNLKTGICAKFSENEGLWQSKVIVQKNRTRTASISEVFALIENILLEQKQRTAFDNWLEKKIMNSKILISPYLKNCMANSDHKNDDNTKQTPQNNLAD